MAPATATQRDRLRELLVRHPVVRAQELRDAGIAGATIARAVQDGEIERVSRGLYKRPEAPIDIAHALAETAKRIPKGVIAMVSALAFHGLTDQMPRKVWVAIGPGEWSPVPSYPPTRIVRFSEKYLHQGIEHHMISGVSVPIYSVAKTLADLYRNSKLVDRAVAVEGLRAALEQRKATPGAIAQAAKEGGAWRIMRPYLEALTFDG
jgi:predicted transcriptional regulator of viral defense system